MKWRKRVEAMALATALVVTGVSPMTVQADEGVSEENVVVEESVESEENNISMASEITVNPPVGLVLGSPKENVLEVVYGPCGMERVARYVIYLDGKAIKEDAQVAFYTFENIEPGEHKVQVTAVLEDGSESDKSKCESTIVVLGEVKEEASEEETTEEETTEEETMEEETTEEETTEDKPVVQTGDVIAISESKESATVGEDITLTFFENKDFSDAISEVLVNGQAVSFDKDSDSIDIDGSYFTSAGVYDIDVKADGYTTAMVY